LPIRTTLGRVAEFTNADTLVWGQYTKLGDQIRIDATLQDRKHNRTIQVKAEAANQQDLVGSGRPPRRDDPREPGAVARSGEGVASAILQADFHFG
jgi:hypothetical protein